MEKFSEEGDTPPQTSPPYGASIFAPTALKLNVTPPEQNPSYGLDSYYKRRIGNRTAPFSMTLNDS